MTDETTLKEIEARRHELMEQQKAWRAVEKYISNISDALSKQIDQTFDEWDAAFKIIYPDSKSIVKIVADVEMRDQEQ